MELPLWEFELLKGGLGYQWAKDFVALAVLVHLLSL